MLDNVIKDIEEKLNISINKDDIKYFNEGESSSIVFRYDKYLIKTCDIKELESYLIFFNIYNEDYFQKIVCYNKELLYICFNFIEGNLYEEGIIEPKDVIDQIYNITSKYKEYDYDAYGYLQEKKFEWIDFLKDEAYREENKIDIDYDKLFNAFEIVSKYNAPKYLLHGDLGKHNFIVNNKKIFVIDPIPLVGDYLYDFYFSIFTCYEVFSNVEPEYILSFFNDRDYEYKKALMTICFYIRLRRTYKYHKKKLFIYTNYLNKI